MRHQRQLERRTLGKTGIAASLLGLGTVKLGRNRGLKHSESFDLPTPTEAKRLLDAARALGVNLLDTAPAYGDSEALLGKLLAGQRQDWVLATKAGEEFDGSQSTYNFTPEHIAMSVRRSLKRLRTDYLDLVLIHSNGQDERIIREFGALDCLADLKADGLVRAIGLSHKSPGGGRAALAAGADVLMATLNAANRTEADLIREARAQGCGVLIKKALNSGQGHPTDLPAIAAHPGVTSILIGTLNPDHLAENARLLSAENKARP